MRKNLIAALAVVVLLAGAATVAVFVASYEEDADMTTSQHATTNTQPDSDQPTSEASATTAVTIQNSAFSPDTIKVKVGDTVTWTNQDGIQHDVVADTESADAPKSSLLAKGETYKFTFRKAGTYTYHCTPHPFMKGTVIVE